MIKLSQAGKMPCKSFSLEAIKTCPGMYLPDGGIKDVCKACYATKGMYQFPVVKAARQNNLEETKKKSFTGDLIKLTRKENKKFFRWFDSGDIYSDEFLTKVFLVCKNTPNVKHWIPTKSRDLFNQERWQELESLPNVTVRFSSDSVVGDFEPGHGSTVLQAIQAASIPGIYVCPSSEQEGKCGPCRACWSKKIPVVGYIFH